MVVNVGVGEEVVQGLDDLVPRASQLRGRATEGGQGVVQTFLGASMAMGSFWGMEMW